MDLIGINELRMAAFAYYHNASQDLQKQARAFFDAMDINRDGRVSLGEFITFFREHGYDWIDNGRFGEFDRDGDGNLDFYEVLTLYYAIKTRSAWCRVCGTWLTRLYFTCVTCFDSGGDTYDLCPACYAKHANNRPHHGPNGHPNIFLDSYVLLRARRGQTPAAPPNMSLQALAPQLAPQRPPARALVLRPAPQRPPARFIAWSSISFKIHKEVWKLQPTKRIHGE
ncbi:hypothetical protein I3842_02G104400 [Carya illinoinensis]|uniref:EF-hand domain-containing protein n=1 Tax=Carya illinoinensis TaxID=32201 RepID=A0A922FQ31_CARIL|nr:hypothetical protein I3842_02G104400 [Carya illinoinensis]